MTDLVFLAAGLLLYCLIGAAVAGYVTGLGVVTEAEEYGQGSAVLLLAFVAWPVVSIVGALLGALLAVLAKDSEYETEYSV